MEIENLELAMPLYEEYRRLSNDIDYLSDVLSNWDMSDVRVAVGSVARGSHELSFGSRYGADGRSDKMRDTLSLLLERLESYRVDVISQIEAL